MERYRGIITFVAIQFCILLYLFMWRYVGGVPVPIQDFQDIVLGGLIIGGLLALWL